MLRYQRSRWTPRIKLYCCIRNYRAAYDAGTSLYVDAVDTRIRRFAYCHGFRGQGFGEKCGDRIYIHLEK
jgi:hypothetical protein